MRVSSRSLRMKRALAIRTPPSPWIGSTSTAATRRDRRTTSGLRFARCAWTNAVHVLARLREELVERVHLAPVGVLALLGVRQAARHQQIPQLLQAALLAPRRFFRRAGVLDRKRECAASRRSGNPSRAFLRCVTARLPSVRPWNAPSNDTMKPPSPSSRRHHAVQQHGLDRVLDRLGAGVDDEVARRAGRRDAVQLGLEPQRQDGLVFGMRVARRRRTAATRGWRWTTAGSFSPNAWVAMSAPMSRKRYGWPPASRSMTARYGPTDSAGIERHRQREEQAARRGLERRMRGRQMLRDQLLERALAVAQRLGHVDVHRRRRGSARSAAPRARTRRPRDERRPERRAPSRGLQVVVLTQLAPAAARGANAPDQGSGRPPSRSARRAALSMT